MPTNIISPLRLSGDTIALSTNLLQNSLNLSIARKYSIINLGSYPRKGTVLAATNVKHVVGVSSAIICGIDISKKGTCALRLLDNASDRTSSMI